MKKSENGQFLTLFTVKKILLCQNSCMALEISIVKNKKSRLFFATHKKISRKKNKKILLELITLWEEPDRTQANKHHQELLGHPTALQIEPN